MSKRLGAMDALPLTSSERAAIRDVWRGEASPERQKAALRVIIEKLCRAGEVAFIEGSPDGTAFLAGRNHVGKLILAISQKPTANPEQSEMMNER